MVPRDTQYPTKDIFLDAVVKINFHYYSWLDICPLWWMALDIWSDVVKRNILNITMTGNVSVARWVLLMVTRPGLAFVIIHWIRWMKWKPQYTNHGHNKKFCFTSGTKHVYFYDTTFGKT